MKKKTLTLVVLMFSMAFTFLFVSSPAAANVNVEGDPSFSLNSAPDKVWIPDYPGVLEGRFMYLELPKYNRMYRGWLSYVFDPVGGVAIYQGYLYRDDLPYPIPFTLPEQLSD